MKSESFVKLEEGGSWATPPGNFTGPHPIDYHRMALSHLISRYFDLILGNELCLPLIGWLVLKHVYRVNNLLCRYNSVD